MSIQLKKYAPLVFHILRKIDGIKLDEYKDSLSPVKNKDKITQSFASGGNSDNPIIFTHDRKYLLKSISRSEKDMLMKILPEYHLRMKEAKSFLCRVYGLYSIMINNKEQSYVIVMKNMCDIPGKVMEFLL
jgi:plasmid maintenance system killer protein